MEPYMPGRALRQLGYVQTIPPCPYAPVKAMRPFSVKGYMVEYPDVLVRNQWEMFPHSFILNTGELVEAFDDPTACDT